MPGGHDRLPLRHTPSGEHVQILGVLNHPPRIGQLAVDEHPGTPLGRQHAVIPHVGTLTDSVRKPRQTP